jgi:hypothetical protein
MNEASVKAADRRQSPRTKLVEIAYIGMGPENGGLVLDVSDGGLSFHAVAPVKPAETLHFLLSLRGHSRIEGSGQVVWTNETRTVCGLRFTSLSDGAREHLNNWTKQARMPATARGKPVSPAPSAPAQNVAPPVQPMAPEQTVAPVQTVAPAQTVASPAAQTVVPAPIVPRARTVASPFPPTLASELGVGPEPVFAIPPAREFYLAERAYEGLWRDSSFFWITLTLFAAAITVAGFFYGVQVGKSDTSFFARLMPSLERQTEPTVPPAPAASSAATGAPASLTGTPAVPGDTLAVPTGTPTSPIGASAIPSEPLTAGSDVPAVPNEAPPVASSVLRNASRTDVASKSAVQSAVQRAAAEGRGNFAPDQHPEPAVDGGKADLAAAMAYLNGTHGKRDSVSAVRLLWSAVANGNSAAEVTLSELYIFGDGVAKSCEQARVLLQSATRAGSVVAKVKLDQLNVNGCP